MEGKSSHVASLPVSGRCQRLGLWCHRETGHVMECGWKDNGGCGRHRPPSLASCGAETLRHTCVCVKGKLWNESAKVQ